MPNQNGKLYGLTFLAPIIDDKKATPSHDLQIRAYLATLPTDQNSPFAKAPSTHLCRLVVMDDVVFVGHPAHEEHLKSKYLIFETNCDSDATDYLTGLAKTIPQQLDAIWSHCVGYPGAANLSEFLSYMKACQLKTTFFFAAVNDKSLPESLRALATQRAVVDFIADHQGMDPGRLQSEFKQFLAELKACPIPEPGAMAPLRNIKTGGRNE
ncbi:MAG TPA: hypothetical protein VNU92_02325 [Edaphobacter sp.]|jgi:hypothetical protein|nr:hypothetical protein [Edaphobacter sp.]